jgi:hypothetical protein
MTETYQIILPPPITRKMINSVNALLNIDLDYDELMRVDSGGIGETRKALRKLRDDI